MAFLQYWSKLPPDFDGMTSLQMRQLADATDDLITRDRQAEAAQEKAEREAKRRGG